MTAVDRIQTAEERVATVQQGLDTVQRVLVRAEEVAIAGQTAKRRVRRLLVVSIVLIAIGIVALLIRRRKTQETPNEPDR